MEKKGIVLSPLELFIPDYVNSYLEESGRKRKRLFCDDEDDETDSKPNKKSKKMRDEMNVLNANIINTPYLLTKCNTEKEEGSEDEFTKCLTAHQMKQIRLNGIIKLKEIESFVSKADIDSLPLDIISQLFPRSANGTPVEKGPVFNAWLKALFPPGSARLKKIQQTCAPDRLLDEPHIIVPFKAVKMKLDIFDIETQTTNMTQLTFLYHKDVVTPKLLKYNSLSKHLVTPETLDIYRKESFHNMGKLTIYNSNLNNVVVYPVDFCGGLYLFDCTVFSSVCVQNLYPKRTVGTEIMFDVSNAISYKVEYISFARLMATVYTTRAFLNCFDKEASCQRIFRYLESTRGEYAIRELQHTSSYCRSKKIWNSSDTMKICTAISKKGDHISYASCIRTLFKIYQETLCEIFILEHKLKQKFTELEECKYTSDIEKVQTHIKELKTKIASSKSENKCNFRKMLSFISVSYRMMDLEKSLSAVLGALWDDMYKGSFDQCLILPYYVAKPISSINSDEDVKLVTWQRSRMLYEFGGGVWEYIHNFLSKRENKKQPFTNEDYEELSRLGLIHIENIDDPKTKAVMFTWNILAGIADCIMFKRIDSLFILLGHYAQHTFYSCPFRYFLPLSAWNILIPPTYGNKSPFPYFGTGMPCYEIFNDPSAIFTTDGLIDKTSTVIISKKQF